MDLITKHIQKELTKELILSNIFQADTLRKNLVSSKLFRIKHNIRMFFYKKYRNRVDALMKIKPIEQGFVKFPRIYLK